MGHFLGTGKLPKSVPFMNYENGEFLRAVKTEIK